ncbi:ATP-binding protein [Flavobacterium sp.]|uniref:ATP-binding protein n=1 Tax=Flavobacterium sp. TaxID=239 RepID=UPI002620A8A2|nr:ATP-binding protein [Flavobacterium sp.]
MIAQQIFSTVIESQKNIFEKKQVGVHREILNKIPKASGFASIITGLRRSGKSTIQLQFKKEYFPNEGLFLNFEDPRFAGIEIKDFERLHNEIVERKSKVLFFDEIQIVKGWEIFVNKLLREDYFVIITGSNASLLSKELGTHLTGRHFSTELFPFSYSEFLTFMEFENNENSFCEYLKKGGMPDYLRTGIDTYLNNLLDDILIRDVAIRFGLRDVNSLRQLAVYLISNIGTLVSANSLSGMFGIKSSTTFLDYFSYFKDVYLIDFVPKFDYSIKKQIRNPQKIYCIDLGIYHQNKITFSPNDGHILENAVYLHLRRKSKEIYYYQNKGECDFVVAKNGVPKELYQVCFEINSMNIDRETNGLFEAMDYFKINNSTIITQNQRDTYTKDNLIINVIPAWQWMSIKE